MALDIGFWKNWPKPAKTQPTALGRVVLDKINPGKCCPMAEYFTPPEHSYRNRVERGPWSIHAGLG